MARRGAPMKKMNLGEFLGDNVAYTPEAALPSGPRLRVEGEDDRFGGRGGYGDRRGGGGFDREASRSDESSQWRGDRAGGNDRGGDRFGSRDGGDRFGDRGGRAGGDRFGGGRDDDGGNWRGGGGGGGSRYDRPSYEPREEARPAHMRLNLSRRAGDEGPSSSLGGGLRSGSSSASDDKFGGAFGSRSSSNRDSGSRFGNSQDERFANSFGNMRVGDNRSAAPAASDPAADKKARAQQMREERKKKAEDERLAAEEAKRVAAETKKANDAAAAKQAETDKTIIAEVLASNKKGEELAAVAKDVFAKRGTPSGAVVVEAVTAAAADVAKASANWIAPTAYGELLKLALADSAKSNQVAALYALQVFLNQHDFPKGVMEKCFMALYSLDIIEDAAFIEYKYDVDSVLPGRMKAIIQTSTWLTWLETPEDEDDEEDDE